MNVIGENLRLPGESFLWRSTLFERTSRVLGSPKGLGLGSREVWSQEKEREHLGNPHGDTWRAGLGHHGELSNGSCGWAVDVFLDGKRRASSLN